MTSIENNTKSFANKNIFFSAENIKIIFKYIKNTIVLNIYSRIYVAKVYILYVNFADVLLKRLGKFEKIIYKNLKKLFKK